MRGAPPRSEHDLRREAERGLGCKVTQGALGAHCPAISLGILCEALMAREAPGDVSTHAPGVSTGTRRRSLGNPTCGPSPVRPGGHSVLLPLIRVNTRQVMWLLGSQVGKEMGQPLGPGQAVTKTCARPAGELRPSDKGRAF